MTDDLVARLRAAGCVYAEEEAALLREAATDGPDLERRVALRVQGLPLEQVVGWAALAGLRVPVAPGVFVPRRRSELLVAEGLAHLRARGAAVPVVVDLCCGSGALGAAVASAYGARLVLHAADCDPAAVECARRTLAPLGGTAHLGDLDAPLPRALRGRVDLLLANAPYVPTGELALLPPEARLHEPRTALDGGPDGLDVQRRVVAAAPGWLAPGGALLVETSERQAGASLAAFAQAGLRARLATDDDLGATVVVGLRP